MEGVEFIRFPKPWRDREKCTRWINACRNTMAEVSRQKYYLKLVSQCSTLYRKLVQSTTLFLLPEYYIVIPVLNSSFVGSLRPYRREGFTTDRVKRDTYICSKHFVGGRGPTDSDPDPVPATTTPSDVHKLGKRRKAPTPRNSEIELLRCTLNEKEGSALAKTPENETVVKYINMYLDVSNVKKIELNSNSIQVLQFHNLCAYGISWSISKQTSILEQRL
ncbi:unnamed protein product [Mytilus coruscus]|uniref:THAP-type domain-containing protein n=1 Tax=Mytilus coruscus TaxID=42192 RepID=A0A6J8DRX1_MYTCO|nr:unnamed protein product [Mytilus coruscus]